MYSYYQNGFKRLILIIFIGICFLQTTTAQVVNSDNNKLKPITYYHNNGQVTTSNEYHHSGRLIIELSAPSLATVMKREKLTQNKSQSTQFTSSDRILINAQESIIRAQQLDVISQLQSSRLIKHVVRRHKTLLNAIVVEADIQAMATIKKYPFVKSVSNDGYVKPTVAESVPLIGATDYWNQSTNTGQRLTGEGIVVAIIDTGVDYTHPALGGCFGEGCKVAKGYDFGDGDGDPMDTDGHGTHVAGIVAGNSDTLKGVAPDATLWAYKVSGANHNGWESTVIAAIEAAADPDQDPTTQDGADIINISLASDSGADTPTSRAVNSAHDLGSLVVVSVGNASSYGTAFYNGLAYAEKALAVASSTKEDHLSSASSRGSAAKFEHVMKPEITAPGENIMSAKIGGGVISYTGTSMAAPHVAGAAALIKQTTPHLSSSQLKERLITSTVDLGLSPMEQGAGRLDLSKVKSLEFTIDQAGLGFGKLPEDNSVFKRTLSFNVANISDSVLELQLASVETENGIEVNVSPANITLTVGQSAEIQATMVINKPDNLPALVHDSLSYLSAIEISSDNQSSRLGVAIDAALYVPVVNNASHAGNIFLVNQYHESFSTFIGFSEIEYARVRPGQHFIRTGLFGLSDAKAQSLGVTLDAEILAYEFFEQNLQRGDSIQISEDNITQVMGLAELTNGSDHDNFAAQAPRLVRIALSGKTSLQGVEVEHAFDAFGPQNNNKPLLMAFGRTDAELTHDFFALYDLDADKVTEHKKRLYLYNHSVKGDSATTNLSMVNANNSELFPINWQSEWQHNNYKFGIGLTGRYDTYVFSDLLSGVEIFHDKPASDIVFGEFFLVDATEDELAFIASSGAVKWDGDGIQKINEDDNDIFDVALTKLAFGQSSTYFSAGLQRPNYEYILFHGIPTLRSHSPQITHGSNNFLLNDQYQNYYRLEPNTKFNLTCDSEVHKDIKLETVDYSPAIKLPQEFNCHKAKLVFDYTSNSFSDDIENKVVYQWDTNTLNYDHLGFTHLAVEQFGKLQLDQTLYATENALKLYSHHFHSIEVKASIGMSGWQSLSHQKNEIDGTFEHKVMLPVSEVSSKAHIEYKLTTHKGDVFTHRLNNFILIGKDAKDSLDSDNDGIINRDDTDDDNDGIPDDYEFANGLDPLRANAIEDADSDGLTNIQEFDLGTSANNPDTDGDGVNDSEDTYPLDATRSVADTTTEKTSSKNESSGGSLGWGVLSLLILTANRRKPIV